ncbi:MAG TPA: PAS domain S-box protein [Desulfomonilaceae bacterium]|nr:PAS domain S-box protein [Desulfomonilaceae bacterium]
MENAKVLIVEDNPVDALCLKDALAESKGSRFVISHVETLAEAKESLRNANFHAVVLDLGLPDSQGLETFFQIQNAAPASSIVVLSGLDDEALALEAIRKGAQEYILKDKYDSHFPSRSITYAIERKQVQEEIRKLNEDLDMRVRERTSQLTAANEELLSEITERKKAEEAVRESETRLRVLMDHSPMGMAVASMNGKVLYLNQKFIESFGYTLQDIPTLDDWWPLAYPDQLVAESVKADWLHFARQVHGDGADAMPVEREVRCKDGTDRVVEFRKTVIGEWVIHTLNDVTEARRQQEALRASEERFRLIAETAMDTIWCLDKDYRFTYISPADEKMRGFKAEELIGQPIFTVIKPDQIENVKKTALNRRKEEECGIKTGVMKHELELVRKDGSYVWTEGYVTPIRDESDQIAGFVGITRDISERIREEQEKEYMKAQLLHAQKMEAIGTLTGGIAHDFNNLLQIINGYTEMLLLRRAENDPICEDLRKIYQTGRKGAEMVQRLLAFSKKTEISPEIIDLRNVVENSVSLMRRSFPKIIEIDTVFEEGLRPIDADESQIGQVLMNLCLNAKEAMPDGGRLRIETRNVVLDEAYCMLHHEAKSGPHILLAISDTGAGMPRETMDRMFDPFFTTKGWDFKKGTGLGLSVAKGIVEQHGGWITCESEPGVGSTFKIYFTAVEDLASAERVEPETVSAPGIGKILLVDDEEYIRELGKRILEQSGHRVVTASNGKEALEIYARERASISLVILDLVMPQITGKKCLEELLRINPRVKVIVSSGHSLEPGERPFFDAIVKGFANKPYQMKQLLDVVSSALETDRNDV